MYCQLFSEREGDGIADAEAHAEIGRSEDTHTYECTQITLYGKVLGRITSHGLDARQRPPRFHAGFGSVSP